MPHCLKSLVLATIICSTLLVFPVSSQASQVTPQAEATQLVFALHSVATTTAIEGAIMEMLDALGVPVYNAAGQPIGLHTSSDPDARVYAIEVRATANAFRNGSLTPLDAVVSEWSRAGLKCEGGPCTGTDVEAMLRAMRAQAALDPSNRSGLFILILDSLGQRADRPFSLIGAPDTACLANTMPSNAATQAATPTPGGTNSPDVDIIGMMLQGAQASGDTEMIAMFQAMRSAPNAQKIAAGLMQGDSSLFMAFMRFFGIRV